MPDLATITIIGVVVLAVLIVIYLKLRRQDQISEFMAKRKANSKLVSRADYVEGVERMPVALSLTEDSLYYENPDLEASFELQRIDEISYDEELSTGKNLGANDAVLRLRSHGTTFEFLLDKQEAKKWMAALPARSAGQNPTAHAV